MNKNLDTIAQLARGRPNRTAEPSPFWFVSELYHTKTKRPGYIKKVATATNGTLWYSVVEDPTGAWQSGIARDHKDRQEAADYVVNWRIMHGMTAEGAKK